MKTRVLLVEDEVLVAEDMLSDLEAEGFEVVGIAISGSEAIELVTAKEPHIVLMDINLKGAIDGIETAEKINEISESPIIYVTSNTSSQFVNRALLTKPHAFITKPYSKKDLVIAIELAMAKYNEFVFEAGAKSESIFVKSGEFHRKVLVNDIRFIIADGSYCKVHTTEGAFTLSFNLNHFQKEVKHPDLMRVHRSYIVNLNQVDGFDKTTLLIGKEMIPVSSSFKDKVFEVFKKL